MLTCLCLVSKRVPWQTKIKTCMSLNMAFCCLFKGYSLRNRKKYIPDTPLIVNELVCLIIIGKSTRYKRVKPANDEYIRALYIWSFMIVNDRPEAGQGLITPTFSSHNGCSFISWLYVFTIFQFVTIQAQVQSR